MPSPSAPPVPSAAVRPHHRFWPKRLPHRITPPATSLWHNLVVNAQRYPDKPALVFFDQSTSYRELLEQAERLAAHLHSQGVRSGDRVILFMQNCPQWIVAHYAILRANAVVVPVNPMNRAEELKHYITDPDVKVAISAADLAGDLLQANAALPEAQRLTHLVVAHYHDAIGPQAEIPPAWTDWLAARHALPAMPGGTVADWSEALACTVAPPLHDRQPADLCVLPYTSGTTGLPKGCMLSHYAALFKTASVCSIIGMNKDDVCLITMPIFHIAGMLAGMNSCIYAGATQVLLTLFDAKTAMQAMRDHLDGKKELYEVAYKIKTASGEYIRFYDCGQIVKKDGDKMTVMGFVIKVDESSDPFVQMKNFRDLIIEGNPSIIEIVKKMKG